MHAWYEFHLHTYNYNISLYHLIAYGAVNMNQKVSLLYCQGERKREMRLLILFGFSQPLQFKQLHLHCLAVYLTLGMYQVRGLSWNKIQTNFVSLLVHLNEADPICIYHS